VTLRRFLDISNIKHLDWESSISLEEGVAKVYRWYQGIVENTTTELRQDEFQEDVAFELY
jgi:dTDP-D-glucose 4,6-dehydratase